MEKLQRFVNSLTSEETEKLFGILLNDLNIADVGKLCNEHLEQSDIDELIAQLED